LAASFASKASSLSDIPDAEASSNKMKTATALSLLHDGAFEACASSLVSIPFNSDGSLGNIGVRI
jgi:hypothetical protein